MAQVSIVTQMFEKLSPQKSKFLDYLNNRNSKTEIPQTESIKGDSTGSATAATNSNVTPCYSSRHVVQITTEAQLRICRLGKRHQFYCQTFHCNHQTEQLH